MAVSAENHIKNKMPTFGETFTPAHMQRKSYEFKSKPFSQKNTNKNILIKNIIRKTPFIFIVRMSRQICHKLTEIIFIWRNKKNTTIEQLLLNYGLSDVANLVKENRMKCSFGLYRNRML